MRFVLLACLLAAPSLAQDYDLSPEVLAFCLDQSDAVDHLDADIAQQTERKQALQRHMTETRLRMNTLRDTARVDARAATRHRALALEWERMVKAFEEADLTLTEKLRERLDVGRVFESHCAGRSYDPDTLLEAEALRQADG